MLERQPTGKVRCQGQRGDDLREAHFWTVRDAIAHLGVIINARPIPLRGSSPRPRMAAVKGSGVIALGVDKHIDRARRSEP